MPGLKRFSGENKFSIKGLGLQNFDQNYKSLGIRSVKMKRIIRI